MVALRYLVDANILSNLTKAEPNEALLNHFYDKLFETAIPAPVWHELLFGFFRLPQSKKRQAIEAFLLDFLEPRIPILEYDRKAAYWHAAERARLGAVGKKPPFIDGQVAAIAFANGLVVVTDNTKDFRHFQGLSLENWKKS